MIDASLKVENRRFERIIARECNLQFESATLHTHISCLPSCFIECRYLIDALRRTLNKDIPFEQIVLFGTNCDSVEGLFRDICILLPRESITLAHVSLRCTARIDICIAPFESVAEQTWFLYSFASFVDGAIFFVNSFERYVGITDSWLIGANGMLKLSFLHTDNVTQLGEGHPAPRPSPKLLYGE